MDTVNRILVGSRALGIHNEHSDYDYVALDLEKCDSFRDVVNERYERGKHCYHFSREYIERLARFDVADPEDLWFIYAPVNYICGVSETNPLDYREVWIAKLKSTDFHVKYIMGLEGPQKRFCHIVLAYYCLKENTMNVSKEAMAEVKRFHDHEATLEDAEKILNAIMEL